MEISQTPSERQKNQTQQTKLNPTAAESASKKFEFRQKAEKADGVFRSFAAGNHIRFDA